MALSSTKSNPKRPCYRCGIGIDSNKDGDCAICARWSDEQVIRLGRVWKQLRKWR